MQFLILILLSLFVVSCSPKQIPPTVISQPEVVYTPPIKKISSLIIIDPGHGGEDQGTLSLLKPRYQEKSLTLATSKILKGYLEQMGYRVTMTRSEDVFIPLKDRATLANSLKPALFVSVHYNSAPSCEAHGIEVFYYLEEKENDRAKASKQLATLVLNQLIVQTKAKSRGVKTANFAVIRETNMPAILVEGGFLTNEEELNKIKDPEYLKQVAFGIAKGIDQYLKSPSRLF